MIGGFPNFNRESPRNTPKHTAKTLSRKPSPSAERFPLATCGRADGFCPTFITDAISTNQPPAPMPLGHLCKASVESAPSPADFPTHPPPKSDLRPARFPQSPETSINPLFDFELSTLDFGLS